MGEVEEEPLPAQRQVAAARQQAAAVRPQAAAVRPPWAPQPVHAVPRRAAERAQRSKPCVQAKHEPAQLDRPNKRDDGDDRKRNHGQHRYGDQKIEHRRCPPLDPRSG
jgi:hypothetical protein